MTLQIKKLFTVKETHQQNEKAICSKLKDERWFPKQVKTKERSTAVRQNKRQAKNDNKRQRRVWHNDQRVTASRRYNNGKYTCSQHPSTKIYKQILTDLKKEIDNNIIIVGEFNTPLPAMDKFCWQKINKEMELNHSLEQINLADIHKTFHLTIEYTWNT